MKSQRPRNRIYERGIGDAGGNDVGKVEVDEVDFVPDAGDTGVAYFDQDEEDDGYEKEEGGEEGPEEAGAGRAFDF